MNVTFDSDALKEQAAMKRVEYPYSTTVMPDMARAIDILCIFAAALFAFKVVPFHHKDQLSDYFPFIIFIAFSYVLLANRAKLFDIKALMRPIECSDGVLVSIGTSFLFFYTIVVAFEFEGSYREIWIAVFFAASFVAVVGVRLTMRWLLVRASRKGLIGRNVVLLGAGEQGRRFLRRFSECQPFFMTVSGVYRLGPEESGTDFEGYPLLGDVGALLADARASKIDDIVIAMPWNADQQLRASIETLKQLPVNVYLSSDLIGFDLAFRPVMGTFSELPMFEITQRPISGWSSILKLIEDYTIATILLAILSPLLLLIAAAIKLDSPGPVLFKQKRLGFNNKEFPIYKFRSMYHREIPETVVKQATLGDPRVTRVGRFIRRTSLDELPQLFNVLNGTMSLVGPRPHAISHNEEFGRLIRGYFARHRVKPGITGWAQVNGLRGETEALDKMERRVAHDVYYAENWSLFFDLKILIMTALVVLFQKTAY